MPPLQREALRLPTAQRVLSLPAACLPATGNLGRLSEKNKQTKTRPLTTFFLSFFIAEPAQHIFCIFFLISFLKLAPSIMGQNLDCYKCYTIAMTITTTTTAASNKRYFAFKRKKTYRASSKMEFHSVHVNSHVGILLLLFVINFKGNGIRPMSSAFQSCSLQVVERVFTYSSQLPGKL